MALILTATQQVVAIAELDDKKGNAAFIDGIPEWATSDPNVLAVQPSADGLTATVVAGRTGAAQVKWTADARKGDEVSIVTAIGDVEVVAGEGSVAKVTFGTPTEQP